MLASVLMMAGRLSLAKTMGRRRALSAAAGGSVAYIFIALLPEIEAGKEIYRQATHAFMPYEGLFGVNLAMMIGFLFFYALAEMMPSAREESQTNSWNLAFWAQILGYGGYICLVGYLLVHSLVEVKESLFLYALSMSLHFLLVGFGLRDIHRENYDRIGRYVLAGFCLAGWVVGTVIEVAKPLVIILFGFVSGGVLSVTGIVELPKGKEGRFAYFLSGALAYALFLISFR
jgi:hypothetical protein